jgi:hypothetical protein
MSLAAKFLDFASAPVNSISFFFLIIIIAVFNVRAQMFTITVLVFERCSIFTLNTIMERLSFMVLVNSQLLVCAMVKVSSSNACQCMCDIHTIYYTMF